MKSGGRLDDIDYSVIVLNKVPFSLNQLISPGKHFCIIASFNAPLISPGPRISTEDAPSKMKQDFVIATSSQNDAEEDLVKYLEELPNKIELLDIWMPSEAKTETFAQKKVQEKASVKTVVCSFPKDEGQQPSDESSPEPRFYYDVEVGSCRSFMFLGAGGNLNNFKSFSECEDICGKFQGIVAEVQMQGYGFSGALVLTQASETSDVFISGQANNLRVGTHGFHVYDSDDLSDYCKNIGSHFNPHGVSSYLGANFSHFST